MTWIRFETTAPDHELWASIGKTAGVRPEAAFYHYFSTLCGLAEHRPDGQISEVSDHTLETWARWRGKEGRWARAFRAHCLEDDGCVKGWWRNQKLIEKQERDRFRRTGGGKTPEKPRGLLKETPGVNRGNPRGFVEGNGNDNGTTSGREESPPEGETPLQDPHRAAVVQSAVRDLTKSLSPRRMGSQKTA